jgi:two-component system sensor histidine kinase KdpD
VRLGPRTPGSAAGRQRLLAGAAFAVTLGVAIAVLLPLRDDLSVGTIALVLLMPVLCATFGGRRVGLAGAVVGALAFNFFFTQPYGSFRIAAEESVAAFGVYLGVAAVLAVVVDRLRAVQQLAATRARDLALLQDMTAEMLRNPNLESTLRSALLRVVQEQALRGACLRVELSRGTIELLAGEAGSALATARTLGRPAEEHGPRIVSLHARTGVWATPIATPGQVFGCLVADPGTGALPPAASDFLQSFAGVAALAVARARLVDEGVRRRALEETDRLRSALFQSVSHDLRTPLTAIHTAAGALREAPDGPARDAILRDVEREAGRLSRLVESMLDLSRIESGSLRPRPTRMPVDELVWGAVEAVGTRGPAALRVDVAEDLPPVSVDETMMRQVLVNLLENAATYADAGPVEIDAEARPSRLVLRVADHGLGIPEAERRRVFEPYLRLRPEGSRPVGSGLGLAISRGFVEAHGGTIRVETTPGGGATFVLELPFEDDGEQPR